MKAVSIYAESTPNPLTLRFVFNFPLLSEEVEYISADSADDCPLAKELLSRQDIKGVFISSNFITLTRSETADWFTLMPEMREFLREWFISGKELFPNGPVKMREEVRAAEKDADPLSRQIMEILDEYIRPAVEGDGGSIKMKSFDNGVVTVILKGSCSGCPSASMTLKAGIENLLTRMVPEVREVVAEEL